MTTLSLRKSPLSQAVAEISPLDLRKPLPTEAMEEVRREVEMPEQIIALSDPERELFVHVDVPAFWSKGALLNVRNRGDDYCITLYPEEFDPRHPERAMMFPNTWTCQDFVSTWYARENPDPRAR